MMFSGLISLKKIHVLKIKILKLKIKNYP